MANKWVDAEGTEHRGSPPQGWWMANDNRWYPPQQAPAQPPPLQPQAQPPSAPTTGEEQAPKKKAWWKTKKAIALWAILGIVVLVNVSGGTNTEGETASTATETSTSESSQDESSQDEASQDEASDTVSGESAGDGLSIEDSSAEASAERTTTTAEPTTTTEATTTTVETTTTTQPPEPVVLSGTGDQVVTVEKPADFVLADISHSGGGGNFAIVSYDAAGGRLDLLVNVIGTYEGRVLVDIGDEQTSALEVTASGPWTVTYYPLTEARVESGSTITGVGDDVFLLDEETSGLTTGEFSTDGGGNFAIWGYTGSGRDLLVNEIGPYTGQGIVDQGTILFQVSAEAAWTVSLS